MSYLTSFYPQTIKAFLETRPALAEALEVMGLVVLIYFPVGLLILWRIKFYRPKPARAKESSPLRLFLEPGLGFRCFMGAMIIFALLSYLVVFLIMSVFVFSLVNKLSTTPIGEWPWMESAILAVIFFFSVFCIWLSGRRR
jgi:hypothetical protein